VTKKPNTTVAAASETRTTEARPQTTMAPSLAHIRTESLRVRVDAVRTINELEAWREEIDATIAFLKAQRT
jgi:hypothetical protein